MLVNSTCFRLFSTQSQLRSRPPLDNCKREHAQEDKSSHDPAWLHRTTRRARLTSIEDHKSGVQLIREFTLDAETSHLASTQIIRNHSSEITRLYHWSRTFAKQGGIVAVPLTQELSRMPKQYVMVDCHGHIDPKPEDPNINLQDNFLEILAPPALPKLGIDSYAGWFAYITPDDLAFVKSYQTYPYRDYNVLAG